MIRICLPLLLFVIFSCATSQAQLSYDTLNGSDASGAKVSTYASAPGISLANRFAQIINVKDYRAVGDTKNDVTTTVTCNAGSNVLTISNSDFLTTDVHKAISIDGCGSTDNTGGVTAIAVSAAGSGYTSAPTVALSNAGSGTNAVLVPSMALVSATVVTGGAGCTDGTVTFQLPLLITDTNPGAGGIQNAQFSGTVSGGVLSGALTVTQPGQTYIIPQNLSAVSAAPQGGVTCTTNPTVSISYGVGSIVASGYGLNYPTSVTASLSGGSPGVAATLGAVTVTPVVRPWTGTIQRYNSPTSVTLDSNASTSQIDATETVTWGTDDTNAITNAFNHVNSLAGTGIFPQVYFPAGSYLVTASLPTFYKVPAAIYGDGEKKSFIVMSPSYSGPALSWSETWDSIQINAITQMSTGPSVDGMTVTGDYSSPNEQDAIIYYDHVDYPRVTNFSASFVSRFIQSGIIKNTASKGLIREGYFANLYCEFCGTPTTPIIEINSVNGTGDSSNLLDWYSINLWAVRGVGVAIRNANSVIGERRFKFYGLRIERDEAGYSSDLLQIGDPTLPGKVLDVAVYGFIGNTVGLGSSAISLYAASASLAPTGVIVDGSINAGGAAGNGINIQAGNTNSFRLSAMSTSQFGVIVGAAPLVGTNNHFDELGLEQAFVPYSIDSSCFNCITMPQYNLGGPYPLTLTTSFGYQALAGNNGTNNSAYGFKALRSNTTGGSNTAVGNLALSANATGNNSVAVGNASLQITTSGGNTAVGSYAGEFISAGLTNTCIGKGACAGSSDTPITGNSNTAIGDSAGTVMQGEASNNAILGSSAGSSITTGSSNLILGYNVGKTTLSTGTGNILLGTSSSVDTPSSGTTNYLDVGGFIIGDVSKGILMLNGPSLATPTSCGTGPSLSAGATDTHGTVTEGTSATGCTIAWAHTHTNTPDCVVSSPTGLTLASYTASTTSLVVTHSSASSQKVSWICIDPGTTP